MFYSLSFQTGAISLSEAEFPSIQSIVKKHQCHGPCGQEGSILSTRTESTMSLFFGMLGVMGFSLTLPMTRLAIVDLDPTFVGFGRSLVAVGVAAIFLWIAKAPRPVG